MSDERHAGAEAHGDPVQDGKRRRVTRRAKVLAGVVLVLLVLGAGRTVMSRIANDKELRSDLVEQSKVYVTTAFPKEAGKGQTLALPGTLQGNVQAPIAARASGYLRRWHKDIGSRVKQGELLAEIDSPETEQQLSQAIAARDQAAASLNIANSTMERWEALRKKDAVSQQELEERRSSAQQMRASLAAAQANVERLRQMLGFTRVVAPFSGVITRRNVDVGDLIDAGGGAGRTMFVLAQTDPLRIYVNVPQTFSQNVTAGQEVTVKQAELPGQTFKGTIARTANAIDPASRTMQVEVTLRNESGVLMPGAYVQVELPLAGARALTIPTNALMIRGDGIRVAALDTEKRVRLKPIKVGRNFGQQVEVLEGVSAKEEIVLNPPDSIAEGDVVAVAPPAKPKDKGPSKAEAAPK